MLMRFEQYDRTGELQKFLPQLRPERMAQLREWIRGADRHSPAAFLEKMNIHLRVQDAQATGLPPTSVDLIFSTGVIELHSSTGAQGNPVGV